MRRTLIGLALAGVAVTSLAAGAASAQIPAPPPPPAPPAPPAPPMEMMAMGPGAIWSHSRTADPEKRAQRLRDVLQLRGDQDGALKAYVEATTPKIEVRKVVKTPKDGADVEPTPPTTLERLDRMTQAGEAMQKRAAATRAFYLALTPSQQKTFDVLGMAEEFGGPRVRVHRFDTRGAPVFKGGQSKVVIERKVG
ncbi:Spy/CpxP family protein refolding chaperone [Caulobacter sp.]|jgi:hypothetical protein|uniref:Spy/CpxP family protein refolding chaperone n=1 Tax=Caulobacter sp. TaxID=78 RepID=UPI00160771C9